MFQIRTQTSLRFLGMHEHNAHCRLQSSKLQNNNNIKKDNWLWDNDIHTRARAHTHIHTHNIAIIWYNLLQPERKEVEVVEHWNCSLSMYIMIILYAFSQSHDTERTGCHPQRWRWRRWKYGHAPCWAGLRTNSHRHHQYLLQVRSRPVPQTIATQMLLLTCSDWKIDTVMHRLTATALSQRRMNLNITIFACPTRRTRCATFWLNPSTV